VIDESALELQVYLSLELQSQFLRLHLIEDLLLKESSMEKEIIRLEKIIRYNQLEAKHANLYKEFLTKNSRM